jgi:hypothetical protein
MTVEWSFPQDVKPSEALERCAEAANECIAADGALIMDMADAMGFVALLRSVARRARIIERIASAQSEPQHGEKVIPFHRRSFVRQRCNSDGDAA